MEPVTTSKCVAWTWGEGRWSSVDVDCCMVRFPRGWECLSLKSDERALDSGLVARANKHLMVTGCDLPGGVLGGLVLQDKHVKSSDIVASRVWA